MRNRSRLLLIFMALCACGILSAQEFRGTISGHVVDQSAAAVPANITVRNTDTNVANAVKANALGEFTVPFLRPGNYSITAEAAGFKQYVQKGIILEVSQDADFTIKMEIGAQTQSIEVTAVTENLDLENASRGADIQPEVVSELPLNYRNPYSLAMTLPGVEFSGNTSWIRPFDGSTNVAFSMNGGAIGVNEVMIDGASNTAMGGSGTGTGQAWVPTLDAVSEVKVTTTPFDASVGRTTGGVTSLAIKTGTNAIHGTLYYYFKRQYFDANTFHNKSQGTLIPRQAHFLDDTGPEIDGPVYIPHVYDGRNKTFFTFSFEKYREGSPISLTESYPSNDLRAGDFSKITNSQQQPIIIYDPLTGFNDPTNTAGLGWSRLPFAGNIIPASRLNATALAIDKYYPQPNGCITPSSGYSMNNWCEGSTDEDNYRNILIKVDHNINAKNKVFFRYGGFDRAENRLTNGIVGPGESGQQPFFRISNSAIADWVGTISPTLIANIHGSYTRFIEGSYGRDNRGFDLTPSGPLGAGGFPASLIDTLPTLRDFGVYSTGMTGLGRGTVSNYDDNFELNGNITKIWKNHTIRAGMDVRQYNYLLQNTGNIFTFSGNTNMTTNDYTGSVGSVPTGYQFAAWELGYVTGAINLPVYPWFRNYYIAPFVQDDWKVTRRLTLNLGLRWDGYEPPYETHNRLYIGFNPTVASPLTGVNLGLLQGGQTQLMGGIEYAGVNGNSRSPYNADYKTVQTRIGGAYKLNEKMVLRAGYGVYYSPLGNGWQGRTLGFAQSTTYDSSNDGGKTPAGSLSNPFPATSTLPSGYVLPAGASNGLLSGLGTGVGTYNRNPLQPRTDQMSLGVQMTVTKTSVLDISYGGSRATNQEQNGIPLNIETLAERQQCNPWDGKGGIASYCDAQVTNPFLGNSAFLGQSYYTSSTVARSALETPFPQFTGSITPGGNNNGKSWYNSAQVSYKYRLKRGLNLIADYTFSKWVSTTGYQDNYSQVEGRGINGADQTHIVKLVAVYQLPFGKNRQFMNHANRLADGFFGGWELNDSYQVHSGVPINFPTNAIMLNNVFNKNVNWDSQNPNLWSTNYCVYQINADNSLTKTTNTNQASCPQTTSPTTGQLVPDFSKYDWVIKPEWAPNVNSPQNGQFRLPRVTTMDASFTKTLKFTERLSGQVRFEVFNVLNHFVITQANINTTATSNLFGTITPSTLGSGSGFPRTCQAGFKLLW